MCLRLIPMRRLVFTRAHHLNFAASSGSNCAIDQHESDHARRAGAVAPGVIRAALNHDVAGAELNVDIVQHHRDLARQHDRVIDGLGSMHERMAPALAEGRGLLVAERREGRARRLRHPSAAPLRSPAGND